MDTLSTCARPIFPDNVNSQSLQETVDTKSIVMVSDDNNDDGDNNDDDGCDDDVSDDGHENKP